jgi:hypothetical protein
MSLLVWWTWRIAMPAAQTSMDLSGGLFSDHFSHVATTRMFPRVGLDLYRRPTRELARPLSLAERERLPADLQTFGGPRGEAFTLEGVRPDKPYVASWTARPRMHPPGDHILEGPIAAAYEWTSLSFAHANVLLILAFLFYGHVSIYLLVRTWLSSRGSGILSGVVVAIVYAEIVHWALEGFYEAAAIGPLLLCAQWGQGAPAKRRPLAAVLAFTIAFTIHFRALFFAPWVLYAAGTSITSGAWRTWKWRGRDGAALAGIGVLSFCSLGVFALLWPTLKALPIFFNPLTSEAAHGDRVALIGYALMALAVGVAFAWSRAWVDLALLAWVTYVFVSLRETFEWDVVSLLAWVGAPAPPQATERQAATVRDARALFLVFSAVVVFRNALVPLWVHELFFVAP